eukprot:COSAG01_NODE_2702_length_7228_cov_4.014869_2_plen_1685_part_00
MSSSADRGLTYGAPLLLRAPRQKRTAWWWLLLTTTCAVLLYPRVACGMGGGGGHTCKSTCQHGGTCQTKTGTCHCTNEWTGSDCSTGKGCDKKPCGPATQGTCVPSGGNHTCHCKAGWFGDQSCTQCPAGRSGTSPGECTSCAQGQYSSKKGATACKACVKGQFSGTLNATACTPCAQGQFSDAGGATECTPCAEGYFSHNPKATRCRKCSTGLRAPKGSSECVAPHLSLAQSWLNVTDNVTRVESARSFRNPLRQLYPGVQKHDEYFDTGFKLAPLHGPVYSLSFTARDQQGIPRCYCTQKAQARDHCTQAQLTNKLTDRIVFVSCLRASASFHCSHQCVWRQVIDRVPKTWFNDSTQGHEKLLQPPRTATERSDYPVHIPSRPVEKGGKKPSNDPGTLNSVCNEEDFFDSKCATTHNWHDTNKEGGTWYASHQFTEHGTFFVAVYMCTGENDYKNCTATANADSQGFWSVKDPSYASQTPEQLKRRVPQTWGSPDHLPATTFTICPEGTKAHEGQAPTVGASLSQCWAKSGWYAPYGPGHPADYCKDGFNCERDGTRWPVAEPDHWVNPRFPSQMEKCMIDGACPGAVGFQAKCTDGPFPKKNPWTFPDGRTKGGTFCFTHSAQIDKVSGRLSLDPKCYEQIGHRCCPGAKGDKCQACCSVNDRPPKSPACDGNQWTHSGGSAKVKCVPCPPNEFTYKSGVSLFVIIVVGLPLVIKVRQLSKHAGATTGPVLSVLNFVQSAELFQGIALQWPPFFKWLADRIFTIFNFNFHTILRFMDFPSPDCAFKLTYLQIWFLIMASPLLILLVLFLSTLLYVTIWKFSGMQKLWALINQCVQCTSLRCSRCQTINTSLVSSATQPLLPDETVAAGWHYRIWEDGGSWQAFSRDHQGQLSAALASEEPVTTLTISGVPYCVDVSKLEMRNMHTGRRRKIRRPWRGPARACVGHDWESSARSASRLILVYLMVGYIFLAGKAMEPLACKTALDGTRWIAKQPDIACDWCSTATLSGNKVHLTYRTLATCSIVMTVIYGLGTPILFGIILFSQKDRLQTNEFSQNYGFLSTKTKIEFFWWEIFISVRKFGVTAGSKFAEGQELPCALINISILFGALIAQVWKQPFANTDANTAETLTLLATVFTLVLGVAQPAHNPDSDLSRMAGDDDIVADDAKGLLQVVNWFIYVLLFVLVGASLCIVARRLVGAWYNLKHLQKLENAATDGRQVPDEIREMLDSRWIRLATAWAAIKAKEHIQDELPQLGDRVRIQTTGAVGFLVQINEQTGMCDIEIVGKETIQAKITEITGEGDIERMLRVFKSARDFRKREEIQRWETILRDWETFFPMADRRIMHIWGPMGTIDEIEDMVWFMRQLHAIEVEQHQVALPRCCSCRGVASRLTNNFLSTGNDAPLSERGELGKSLRLFGPVATEKQRRLPVATVAELPQRTSSHSLPQDATTAIQRLTMTSIDTDHRLGNDCVKRLKQAAYRNLFSSGIRTTATCVWALFSFILTLTCIIRCVAAGNSQLSFDWLTTNDDSGNDNPSDEWSNSSEAPNGTDAAISGPDTGEECSYPDSGAFWILLMLSYWLITTICVLRARKSRQLRGSVACYERCCRCCCCCTNVCARRLRRRQLTTFETHGIDSVRFGGNVIDYEYKMSSMTTSSPPSAPEPEPHPTPPEFEPEPERETSKS